MPPPKPVRLTGHAKSLLAFRGTSEHEVAEAIHTCGWQPAELGRMECRKDYPFNAEWNRHWYRTKQVRPIFVDESDEVVVVTVYVYYF